ncbi:MAG: GIY-YIG nuclease family protein [Rickettsiales bacterium]|nr:GIY-YIG nuclease family protein [Rickettsiales bacterium]
MARGIVYIFINSSIPDWVKIGYTDSEDIQSRLRQVNACTEVPLMFRPYALLYSNNPYSVEQRIHRLFDIIDPSLHSIEKLENGKRRIRP